MEEKLRTIEEKIKMKKVQLDQKEKFHGLKALTRHEMELERSLLRDCTSDDRRKVMSSLTTVLDPRDTTQSNNPMNQLPEILENITKGSNKEKSRRKRRQKNKNSSPEPHLKYPANDESPEEDSLEGVGEVATCEPRPRTPVPEVSLEQIKENKLTIEEIRNIPRFSNYAPGEPSQVTTSVISVIHFLSLSMVFLAHLVYFTYSVACQHQL